MLTSCISRMITPRSRSMAPVSSFEFCEVTGQRSEVVKPFQFLFFEGGPENGMNASNEVGMHLEDVGKDVDCLWHIVLEHLRQRGVKCDHFKENFRCVSKNGSFRTGGRRYQ